MSGIVCAIRGGPDSQPTIQTAIEVAKKSDQTIYFLYIVNLDFLTYTSTSRVQVVAQEMHQMGEFILLTAPGLLYTSFMPNRSAKKIMTLRAGLAKISANMACTNFSGWTANS